MQNHNDEKSKQMKKLQKEILSLKTERNVIKKSA